MNIIFHTKDRKIIDSVNNFIAEWNSSEASITVYTSGSTGTPKAIRILKDHMRNSAQTTCDYLDLKEHNTALLCLSSETIAGKMMIVRSVMCNMDLIVTDVTSNPLEDLDMKISFAAMVPLQIENSIKHDKNIVNAIDKIIVGGGTVSDNLAQQIASLSNNVFHTFGMTETISHVAMRNLDQPDRPYDALPGTTFAAIDGQLVVKAPHLGQPELKTNDIVELLSPTSFKWIGRADFVINSGGIKIHPEEIEKQLNSLIAPPFFSTGIPDDKLGQRHILCVEGQFQDDLSKIEFEKVLQRYHIPKEIYFFPEFSYTKSGKINRSETLKQLKNVPRQVL